ncbi:MAG: thiamine phosphate synthase [Treponema sp.]|jgi:thiamine-phosphate pyrophosphorylase|nr:thiamine phosphate synthase [Treponema sp.]
MLNKKDLLLYLCTNQVRPITQALEEALAGGVTMVQIREKDASTQRFYEVACMVQALTRRYGVPLVINDRIDIALAVNADGVHLGQSDMPLGAARKLVGNSMFIGVSAGTLEQALAAQKYGADYLGVGPVYPTTSKADVPDALGTERLRVIREAVHIPVIGIGGIGPHNIRDVMQTGVAGVAVISAILSQPDIKAATQELRDALGCFPV